MLRFFLRSEQPLVPKFSVFLRARAKAFGARTVLNGFLRLVTEG
jgi:hypothetical protein